QFFVDCSTSVVAIGEEIVRFAATRMDVRQHVPSLQKSRAVDRRLWVIAPSQDHVEVPQRRLVLGQRETLRNRELRQGDRRSKSRIAPSESNTTPSRSFETQMKNARRPRQMSSHEKALDAAIFDDASIEALRPNVSVSAAAAHDRTSRRRLQTRVG